MPRGVVVTHTLPAGVGYVSDDGACDTSGLPELVCNVGALASGADSTINVLVSVPPDTPDGTVLLSDASVAGNEPDSIPANNVDDETTDVVRLADLEIIKTGSHDSRAPGELLTYTLTVENLGPGDASGVVVTDTVPAGVSYESDDGGCDASGEPVIVCAVGNLAAGASIAIQIVVRVDLATQPGALLENRAEVTGDQPDPDPGNDEDTVITTVTPLADLRVDKDGVGEVVTGPTVDDLTETPGVVTAGRRMTYTLTVGNGGPTDASGVVVTDTLPAGVSYVSDDASCDTFALPVLRCELGVLASGASTMVTIVVDADPGLVPFSMLENLVVVSGDDPDPDLGNNSDDHSTTVLAMADLSIDKTAAPPVVTPGDPVTFDITVTNAGPSLARDVVVEDTLPVSLTYVSDSAGCDTVGLPTLSCALGDMAPGVSVSFDVTATVEAGLEGQTVSNTATVQLTGGGSDPDLTNNSDTTMFDVEQEADLSITKTGFGEVVLPGSPPDLAVMADAVSAGQRLTYTLHVTNTGPADAPAVVVTDSLPAGVSYVSDDAGCDASGAPDIVCALGALPSGGSAWVTILVEVDPAVADGSSLVNNAVVDGGMPDPNPGDNSTMQTTLVSALADLMVVKTADPSTVDVGELVTFSLTVANAGPATAASAVVTDTLPPDFSYVSDDGSCDTSGLPAIVCALGDLPPGAMSKVEIVASAEIGAAGQSRTNVARVGLGSGADADPSNDEDDAEVDVRPRVDLAVSKAGAGEVVVPGSPPGVAVVPNTVTAGKRLTYTLDVSNGGPSAATGVVLTDTLPAGTSYVSAGGAACSTLGLPTLSCTLPSLGPGGMVTVIVVVDVDAGVADGAVLRNTTGVTANESEADPSNNADTQDTEVGTAADLALSKAADPPAQSPGGLVTYTLTIDNLGPSDAAAVVVTDTLPADVSYVSDDAGCDTSGLPQITCALGGLASGDSAMVRITVQVDLAAQNGAELTNMAVVGSGTPDPDGSNNDGSATVTVRDPQPDEADLAIDKTGEGEVVSVGPTVTVTPDEVTAGRRLTWTLYVSNAGPATATGVVVTDTLPAGTSFVSASVACDTSGLPQLVCVLPDLASGANTSFTVTADVDALLADGALLDNTAAVGGTAPDGNPANNTATHRTVVRAAADLTVIKTADPNQVEPGGLTTFTLQATNLGPSLADDVRLIDTLPAGLAYVSDDGGCDTGALPTLTCDVGDLAPGASATVQVVAQAVGVPDTMWTNTVTVVLMGDGNDPDPSNNSDSDDVDIVPMVTPVDLSLEKSGAGEFVTSSSPPGLAIVPGLVSAGRRLTYTLTVRNVGATPATGIVVSDTLPSWVSFVSSSEPCNITGAPVILCDAPDLGPGAMATVVVAVDVSPDAPHFGVLTNLARVDADMPDSDPSNNDADQDTTVFVVADLALEKTAEPDVVAEGGSVTFVLTATNLGPSLARDVALEDTLPAGLTYTGDDGGCDTTSLPTITCDLGDLAPGGSAEVRITATADGGTGGQTLTNLAIVSLTGEGTDPDLSNNDASAEVRVEARVETADLALDKTGAGAVVLAGSPPGAAVVADQVSAGLRLTYTLSVSNAGPGPATGVTVSDTLPAGVSFVSATVPCDASGAPLIVCTVGSLDAGGNTSFEMVVDVASDVADGTVLDNVAVVGGDQPDSDPSNDDAAQSTDVSEWADLALTKTAEPGVVEPGGTVTFTIRVDNLGPALARGVRVIDTLPTGLTYLSDTAGCSIVGLPTLSCDLGDVAAGSSIGFQVVVRADLMDGEMRTNTASALLTGTGSDPDPSNNSDSDTVEVREIIPPVDLSLAKTGEGEVTTAGSPPGTSVVPNSVTAGRRLTYTLTVTNVGPEGATGVVVSDTLPAGVTFVDSSVACDTSALPIVRCDLGALAPAAMASVTIEVDVDADLAPFATLDNVAEVSADQPDSDPSNNDDDQTTTVLVSPDVAVLKTAEPSTIFEGQSVTFLVTVTNLGPSLARDVELVDTLPAGLVYASDDGGCDTAALPVITCDLGDLAPGASATVSITAQAALGTGGQMLTNGADATVTGGGTDPDSSNDSDDATVDVRSGVDLAVSKAGEGEVVSDGSPPGLGLVTDRVSAGRQLTYTLTVENLGMLAATNVVLSDTLPVSVTYLSDTGGCDTGALPLLQCALGGLAAGASTSVAVVVDVAADTPDGAQILNAVEAEADEPEADTANNSADQTTDVDARSDLSLAKTASRFFVTGGDLLTFEIEAANDGPSLARDVRVTDTLPVGLSYVSDTDACVQGPVGTLVCELGDILPGASTAFDIVTSVGGGLFGTTLTNTATVGLPGGGSDPDPSNDTATATVRVVDPGNAADLTIKKSITETLPIAGALITYTVDVANAGPAMAVAATVFDTLTSTDPGAVRLITTTLGADCVLLDDFHIDCDLGDIPSGGIVSYKVTGQLLDVPDIGEPALYFTNTVIVDSESPDLVPGNNQGFAWVEVLPAGFLMNALPFAGTQASLLWEDASVGEVDFLVEGRAGRAPFAPLAVIPSADIDGRGRAVQWLSEPLPAGRDYVFRVIARDAAGAPLASAGRSLRIPARPRAETACVDGQIVLPGRGQHVAWLAVDGLPLESTSASGAFQLCGLPPGGRALSAFRDGWLQAETRLSLAAGGTRELPQVILPAGDHDRNGRIDVADLARVSARVGLEPVDRRADLDGDGRVTSGDLVILSRWLDAVAPASWSGR